MSPQKKPTLPVDIYVRVSRVGGRDVQADGGTATEQEAQCRAQLLADGLEAGQVFIDLDESGGKTSRPEFDVAMQRVRDGQSGGIIAKNLRRFGRTTQGVILGIQEIEAHGGTFISCEEKVDTSTPMGRFVLTILAALGQMELEERTQGFAKARGSAVDRGIHVSSRVPAGYVRGADRVLVPSEHAPAILEAFTARAEGATWIEVAAILTAAGVPKSRKTDGPVWSEAATAALCQNRVYLGEARSGEFVKPDAHPAIVDAGLFARVQARRGEKDSFTDPTRRRELLAGLVRCGTCGASMVEHVTKKPSGKRYSNWRCSGRCSAPAMASRKGLEKFVFSYLVEHGAELNIEAPRSNDAAIKAAQIRLDNAQAALDDLNATAASRGLSPVDVIDLAASYRAEVEEAAAALNDAKTGDTTSDWAPLSSEDVADEDIGLLFLVDVGPLTPAKLPIYLHSVNQFDNARARRLVRSLVKSVVVRKATSTGEPLADRVDITLV